MSNYIKIEDILKASNGGLDIILSYYPEANDVLVNKKRNFKVRANEKTASATLKEMPDGTWIVTDFGGDGKPRNAIAVCQFEESIDFGEACQLLGAKLNLTSKIPSTVAKPIYNKRLLNEDEIPGNTYYTFKDFTKEELAVLGPRVNADHLGFCNLKSVAKMVTCYDTEAAVKESTPEYPIFCFDNDTWQKTYEPKNFKKHNRFRHSGDKPKTFCFGLDYVKSEYNRNKARVEDEAQQEDIEIGEVRLENVILCSGGSDAINLFSMANGNDKVQKTWYVIWLNSESEKLSYDDYKTLKTCCVNIYSLPDIDKTGITQGIETAFKYLDIKTIWLPSYLRDTSDWRGGNRKDFKDFVEKYYKAEQANQFITQVKKLIENALPMMFWDERYNKEKNYTQYFLSNTKLYHFLKHSGFGKILDENSSTGYKYVYKDGNIIRNVLPIDIEMYVHDFLAKKQLPIALRDMVYKNAQVKESSLNKLPVMDLEFKDCTKDLQYMFFQKETWEITANDIVKHRPGTIDNYVWEDKIIDHHCKIETEPFKISKDNAGNYDIDILDKDNQFFNYLINGSRIHWRKDLEDSFNDLNSKEAITYAKENKFNIAGSNLNENEVYEQKGHLINKIFSLGYMLHKYKDESKAWAVYVMDNKLCDIGESHGGSGKSLGFGKLINVLKRRKTIDGRVPTITKNEFIYHGVTEDTDYIFIDDAHAYLDYNFFFSAITGTLNVNPKQGAPFEIPFEDSPKFVTTSNFPPRSLDPSLARRLLFVVYSDYYHFNKDGEYNQVRQVSDDFNGQNLFSSWDTNQWNKYFNFLARCVQFYLSHNGKFDAPNGNIQKRNLMAEMGDNFRAWAEVFFAARNHENQFANLNTDIPKSDMLEDFKRNTGLNKITSNKFKKSIKAFCKFNGWNFGDTERNDKNGRILVSKNGKTQEVFFIKAEKAIVTDSEIKSMPIRPKAEGIGNDDDDYPF